MKQSIIFASALSLICLASCTVEFEQTPQEVTVITVSLTSDATKTTLGASSDSKRNVYWSNGDRMSLNGTVSNPLSEVPVECSSADFVFAGTPETPYNLLYPASFYKNASTITLPATQSYADGSFATDTEPLAGYAASAGDPVSLTHLCSIVQLKIKQDAGVSASSLSKITFRGNAGEQVTGDFTINYSAGTITSASSADADKKLDYTLSQALSTSTPVEIFLVVPARTYASGFTVVMEDNYHRTMTKSRASSTSLDAGKVIKMTEFTFVPGALSTEFTIADVTEEVIPPDGYNITGRVVDSSSNPLEGVVVSDGTQCVRTMFDGTFYMESTIPGVKFVHVSTPSGYMPAVSGGIPVFYKKLEDVTPAAGIYDFGDFVLTPVANPNRFTLLITADPQPRQFKYTLDKIAYKSLDVCQDLYQELYDVASGISDRQVYGICLGDIVHEDMSLYANYASALSTLGYPTYNIIGNHDNDYDVDSDDEAGAVFESYFGPRNYSFNIGGIHFVMLDNLIMKDDGTGSFGAYDQGLTDQIWTWLQNDMAYIPTSTTVMVCAHSPMFKQQSGSERTNTAYHGGTTSNKDGGAFGYGDLFDQYTKVHAWAGHTHSGFNFIYGKSHRHKNVEVHTLARSTGELWTNDYLANGTPRGFTVVEVNNGEITWKFHPLTRQRGAFQGVTTGYCSAGAPAYEWRDWDYNGSGVAVMRDGSGALTEDYQMHVYPRSSYGDNYVYANVFLWDEKWDNPVWTPDGGAPVTMTRICSPGNALIPDPENIYDKADTEFRTWYKTYANKSGGSLAALDGYTTVADDKITTLFRAPATASPSSGTVTVTDRFGNVYSRTISW